MRRLERPGMVLYIERGGCWSLLWFALAMLVGTPPAVASLSGDPFSRGHSVFLYCIFSGCFAVSLFFLFRQRAFLVSREKGYLEIRRRFFLRRFRKRVPLERIECVEAEFRRVVHRVPTRMGLIDVREAWVGNIVIRLGPPGSGVIRFMRRVYGDPGKQAARRLARDLGVDARVF